MDDVTWAALTAALTVLFGLYTVWAFRQRGAAAGTRGLALTLLPAAAWLTGTLRMFTRIADAIADWATSLVFDPRVWSGTALAGLSVVLWLVGGYLHGRNAQRAATPTELSGGTSKSLPRAQASGPAAPVDDDMADIEAMLRKRGIT